MLFRSWLLFFLFQPGSSAKFNPLKVHGLQNAISVSQFTISKEINKYYVSQICLGKYLEGILSTGILSRGGFV